jgi:hypothetical protein
MISNEAWPDNQVFQTYKKMFSRWDLPPTIADLSIPLLPNPRYLEEGSNPTVFILIMVIRHYCHAVVEYTRAKQQEPSLDKIYAQLHRENSETTKNEREEANKLYKKLFEEKKQAWIKRGDDKALKSLEDIVTRYTAIIDVFLKNGIQVNKHALLDEKHLIDEMIKLGYNDDYPAINTPLNIALLYNSEGLVEELIKKGANLNEKDFYGATPLYYAIKNNNLKMVHYLLEKGADANIVTKNTKSKLTMEYNDQLPVVIALKQNKYEIASILFAKTDKTLMQAKNVLPIIINNLEYTEKNHNDINNELLLSMMNMLLEGAPNATLAAAAKEIKGGRRKSRRRRINRKKRTIRRRR